MVRFLTQEPQGWRSRNRSWRRIGIVVAACGSIGLAILLARSCGDGEGRRPGGGPDATPTPTPTAKEKGEPALLEGPAPHAPAHSEAEDRRILTAETDRMVAAMEEGRAFGRENQVIVEAHFSVGTNQWSVRSLNAFGSRAPATSLTLRLSSRNPWPATQPGMDWRFRTFRALDGETAGPVVAYFPGGHVWGGEIRLGWDTLLRVVRVDDKGAVACRFETPGDAASAP